VKMKMKRPLSALSVFGSGRPPSEEEVRSRLEPFAALDPTGSSGSRRGWTQAWRGPEGDRTTLRLSHRESTSLPGPFLAPDVPDRLRVVASWVAAPPATELYRIHAVHPGREGGEWWLHTHGLQRIGLPDLEILRVPKSLVESAAELIRTFVRAHAGDAVPTRGRCDHLVQGGRIEWIPVPEAIPSLRAEDLGGLQDRGGSGSHRGRRAAFVEPGLPRSRWRPPLPLLRGWEECDLVFGLPATEAARTAALARERWSVFARLFAAHGQDAGWRFHASVACATPGGGVEHLWWAVLEVEPRRVLGRLESRPAARIPLAPGDEAWHDLSRVSDWSIEGPLGAGGPDTVEPPE
jgi:hypothetical protein